MKKNIFIWTSICFMLGIDLLIVEAIFTGIYWMKVLGVGVVLFLSVCQLVTVKLQSENY